MAIFFCTMSKPGAREANGIQVRAMAQAFSKVHGEVFITYRGGWNPSRQNNEGKVRAYVLRTLPGRVGVWVYSIQAWILYLALSFRRPFEFAFSRSILFSALTSFGTTPGAFEMHSGVGRILDKLLLSRIIKGGTHIVCISAPILKEVCNTFPLANRVHVFGDGHDFHVVEAVPGREDRPFGSPIKVGYFGSLSPQKGLEILKDMTDSSRAHEFHVYSKEFERLPDRGCIAAKKYLPHDECFEKMREMDVLLLMVVPQGRTDRISQYTSPLKLFEYMAAGRPVVASDLPVLREAVPEGIVHFCQNNAEAFMKAIEVLSIKPDLRQSMVSKGLEFARNQTWERRAQDILSKCGSKNGIDDIKPIWGKAQPCETSCQKTA